MNYSHHIPNFNTANCLNHLKQIIIGAGLVITASFVIPALPVATKPVIDFYEKRQEEMLIDKPPIWDGKWRLVIYDVKKEKEAIWRNLQIHDIAYFCLKV